MKRVVMLLVLLAVPFAVRAAMFGRVSGSTARAMQWQGAQGAVADTDGTENFFPIMGPSAKTVAAGEGNVQSNIATGGTVSNLYCYLTTAGGVKTVAGGTSYTLALRDNATDSALTCAITAAQMSCTDTTDSVTVAASDQLDFSTTSAGTPTALEAHCSAVFAF